jgi:hypothetical protein
MKEKSPFEKLDAALRLLADKERSQLFYKSLADVTKVLSDIAEAEIVLNKLVKDGYADKIDKPPSNDYFSWLSDRIYFLTFEGEIFLKKGGYVGERKRKRLVEFPKNYWWIMLPIGLLIGWFADIGKEVLTRKLLQEKKTEQQAIPTFSDTSQNNRMIH